MIYLDYSACTLLPKAVKEAMEPCLQVNPHAQHKLAKMAKKDIQMAKKQIGGCIKVFHEHITFTSGATESINLALFGVSKLISFKKHIITSEIEHAAVKAVCKQLELQGFNVTYLMPDANGVISAKALKNALQPDTLLVSLMHINNEVGSINPIYEYIDICKKNGTILHIDAAQSIGKVDFNASGFDLVSLSSHKAYGPSGIGALYVNPSFKLPVINFGASQQRLKSGTMPVSLIKGMGKAYELMQKPNHNAKKLKEQMIAMLGNRVIENIKQGSPYITSLWVQKVNVEAILSALWQKNIAVSRASACNTSNKGQTSIWYITKDKARAFNSFRVSIGRDTSIDEIKNFCKVFNEIYDKLISYA